MNHQNEPAQLRFLEETANQLRQNGFTVEPIEDHHLPVSVEKGRLCRISGKGSVLYRQENVDNIRAQDALQTVIDTVKMTSEYMAILETAPRLKASGLDGDYRVLADFGDAVLAAHPTERGVQFVTWEWDFDRKGVHHGHYFQDNYDAAKWDFTVRGNLVPKDALFEPEQLMEDTLLEKLGNSISAITQDTSSSPVLIELRLQTTILTDIRDYPIFLHQDHSADDTF